MPPSQPTTAGIITDETGTRQIPASTRADGSTRRAIKIRPGYQPPEDVALYKNRTAESFRNRYKGGVPGAESAKAEAAAPVAAAAAAPGGSGSASISSASTAANKNAKRREARKKAAAAATGTTDDRTADAASVTEPQAARENAEKPSENAADPQAEREKKARGLRKKLKQARELQSKKDGGATLLPEQIAKVIRINELIRELETLGLDANETEAASEAGGSGNTTT